MSATDTIKEALREFVGDGDGADEKVLAEHDAEVTRRALPPLRLAWVVLLIATGLNLLTTAVNFLGRVQH
jgi:hypothetical protein